MRTRLSALLVAALLCAAGPATSALAGPAAPAPVGDVTTGDATTMTVTIDRGDGTRSRAVLTRRDDMLGRQVWSGALTEDPMSTVVLVRHRDATLSYVSSRFGTYQDVPIKGMTSTVRRRAGQRIADAHVPAPRPRAATRSATTPLAGETDVTPSRIPVPGTSTLVPVVLGSPIGSPYTDRNGVVVQNFQYGVTYTRGGATVRVGGPVLAQYQSLGKAYGALGYPRGDQFLGADGMTVQGFDKGEIYWRSDLGATYVRGANLTKYAQLGYEAGSLGAPVKGEYLGADGVTKRNDFSNAAMITNHPSAGVHVINGVLLTTWLKAGAEKYGVPSTDVVTSTHPVYGRIRRVDVRLTADATSTIAASGVNAYLVQGGVRDRWVSLGAELGALGAPTSDELSRSLVSSYQEFQGGIIVRGRAGAQPVVGRILEEYRRRGAETGSMGAPTAAEIRLDTGIMQSFENGDLYYGNDGTYRWAPRSSTVKPTVDMLWAYTDAAEKVAGSETAMLNRIVLGAAVINKGAADSEANFQVRVVGTMKTATVENGDMDDSLARLQNTGDTYYQDITAERERVRADVAQLITNDGEYCGLGYVNSGFSPDFSMSVVAAGCSDSGSVQMHEMGHSLGLSHDHYTDKTQGALNYNLGYTDLVGRFTTMMAYEDECRDAGVQCTALVRYSNPRQSYNGRPLGVPIGRPDAADSVTFLNDNVGKVAAMR